MKFYIAAFLTFLSTQVSADTIQRNLSGVDSISVTFNNQIFKKSENNNYRVSITEGNQDRIQVTGSAAQLKELVIESASNQLNIRRNGSWFAATQTEPVQISIETRSLKSAVLDGEFTATIALANPHKKLAMAITEGTKVTISNIQAEAFYLDVKYGCQLTLDKVTATYFFAKAEFGSSVSLQSTEKLSNLELMLGYGSTWDATNTLCENCKLSAGTGSSINFNKLVSSRTQARTGSSIN